MIYKAINILHRITGKILARRDKKNKLQIITPEQKWNSLFTQKNKIVSNLTDGVKINLYQDSILSQLIYEGFEKNEISFMEKNLKSGDIFVDIGANVGLFSLIASPIVGNEGQVIAFEPSPTTFKRLNENISLNNFKNIDARNLGLSDKKDKLKISISTDGHDAWNTFAPGDAQHFSQTTEVDVDTLDNQLSSIELSKIKIIKIDVEGWEKFVIMGAKKILIEHAPVVMMEFTETNTFAAGYMVQDLYDMFTELNYSWFEYVDNTLVRSPKRLHYPYNNLIAIKNK